MLLQFFNRFKSIFLWIWNEKGRPGERARGLAVGVLCGCFPFFGLQSLMGIFIASLIRGHRLLAAIGTWISNPLTYLPLYWLNYKIGAFFLGQEDALTNREKLTHIDIWEGGLVISSRILLGSLIIGIFLGLLTGCISYILFLKISRKKN